LVPAVRWRLQNMTARRRFDRYAIEHKTLEEVVEAPSAAWDDTAVTPFQARYLLTALRQTEDMSRTVVVEIGSFRGVTTRYLAQNTDRRVIAIDPFLGGYGGYEEDLVKFKQNTQDLPNVIFQRATSGEAFSHWSLGSISFVFIDAEHNYANVSYDRQVWSSLVCPHGMVAMHDIDSRIYAGARRAAFEGLRTMDLYARVDNLVILRKRAGT
jgi:predicted O-methyltransferase YrrM